MKNLTTIFFVIVLVIFAVLLIYLYANKNSIENINISIKNQTFYLQKAVTINEKEKGLMNIEKLEEYNGMIFIFDDEQPRSFWMKNTLIPLDQIFINKNKVVVDIIHNFRPCISYDCPSYLSKPAMYVIEINAGLAEKLELKEGDEIEFEI